MSKLALPSGDDHPEAAHKNLQDARVLLDGNRADGAAYLSGYVAECALKTIYQHEKGTPIRGHDLRDLVGTVSAVAAVAGAKTARYFGRAARALPAAAIAGWTSEMRYRPAMMTLPEAETWYIEAKAIFDESVAEMKLDGVL